MDEFHFFEGVCGLATLCCEILAVTSHIGIRTNEVNKEKHFVEVIQQCMRAIQHGEKVAKDVNGEVPTDNVPVSDTSNSMDDGMQMTEFSKHVRLALECSPP